MRIGLVNFLNARPLDYGLRRSSYQLVEAQPSVLYKLLLAGELDCALISSVECLRNPEKLSWYKQLGVCSKREVRSVLYIQKKENADRQAKIQTLWADAGSRSSLALWQCLYFQLHKQLPEISTAPAREIPGLVRAQSAGLLIGDAALEFSQSQAAQNFALYDLGEWWYTQERLPFVFALWAYPLRHPIEKHVFEDSFAKGWENISKITESSPLTGIKHYLTKNIHYRLGQADHKALERFETRLADTNLL